MDDKMKNNLILIMGAALVVLLAFILFGKNSSSGTDPRLVAGKDSKSGKSPYHRIEIKNTMTKYVKPVRDCYNDYLESSPEVTDGEIMVDWQIDSDGDVVKAEVVRSGFTGEKLGNCIVGVISSIEFPPPPSDKNVYADYKFFFKKVEEPNEKIEQTDKK